MMGNMKIFISHLRNILPMNEQEIHNFLSVLTKLPEESKTQIFSFMTYLISQYSVLLTAYVEIFNNIEDAVVYVDNNFKILYTNDTASKLLTEFDYMMEILENDKKDHLLNKNYVIESLKNNNNYYQIKRFSLKNQLGHVYYIKQITEVVERNIISQQMEHFSNIGLMSAGLVHDIRNPITVIEGFVKLLGKSLTDIKLDDDKVDNNKMKQYMQIIVANTHYVSEISANFNEFNKLENMKIDTVDSASLIEEAKKILSSMFNNIEVKTNNYQVYFEADQIKILRILVNLIKNGVESIFTKEKQEGEIGIYVEEDVEYVYFKITDNGIGIESEHLNNLFKPYSTTKEFGHGIGLVNSLKLAQQHNGDLYCENSSPEKTTFVLKIAKSLQLCGCL